MALLHKLPLLSQKSQNLVKNYQILIKSLITYVWLHKWTEFTQNTIEFKQKLHKFNKRCFFGKQQMEIIIYMNTYFHNTYGVSSSGTVDIYSVFDIYSK